MTLIDAILKKVQTNDKVNKYPSPPPEIDETILKKKRNTRVDKFGHVAPAVDTSPPLYDAGRLFRNLPEWTRRTNQIYFANVQLLGTIAKAHLFGKVDSRWKARPEGSRQYYENRRNMCKLIQRQNKLIYKRILETNPRVAATACLERDWRRSKQLIVRRARKQFLLFPTSRTELMEDQAFACPHGVTRPRVYIKLRTRNASLLGTLEAELFADVCPQACRLFMELLDGDGLGHGYVGTRFFSPKMLVSDNGLGGTNDILVKVVSPEGQIFSAYFPEDTLIEELKNRAVDYFYPTGENRSGRFKVVRVCDTSTLHDFLTLGQEEVMMHEELLLIERRAPEAGTLWDLGAVRAPQHAAIVAATASLPNPQDITRQPNLQSLLSTNELSYELKKILISLIEAGARLAVAGRNYELTLAQLSAALDEPRRAQRIVAQVITPEELAAKLNKQIVTPAEDKSGSSDQRAECLEIFLSKFRMWRRRIIEPPNPEAIAALRNLGYSFEEADEALRCTGCNVPAAASWLIGERGSSVFELVNGLPEGVILQTLLKQPQIQRGLLNTRMLIAFIAMVGQSGSASLWLNSPHGSPLLSQISRTYHSEKYCLAVNQFSERQENGAAPSTSRQTN